MPDRPYRPCKRAGCSELTRNRSGYCDKHTQEYEQKKAESKAQYDKRRKSSSQRGYGYRWQQYSKAFLQKPANVVCKLHLPGCTVIAQCVDHIKPPSGPDDPLFWDKENHQAACIHCNSLKGHKTIRGEFDLTKL